MTLSKPAALFVALAAAAVFVVGLLVVLDRHTRDPTPYEKQARTMLGGLGEPTGGVIRVVILGDSLGRNAFGPGPELETALAGQGVAAEVVNLSAPGTDLNVAEPVFDEILAVRPDVIVVQTGLTIDTDLLVRPDLRRRIITWLRGDDEPDLFELRCGRNQADATLAAAAERAAERYDDPVLARGAAQRLVDGAEALGAVIVLFDPPVSDQLAESTGPLREVFRDRVANELAGHVVVADDVAVGDLGAYCDFAHLNAEGRQTFLARWAPRFAALLERIG